jgi:hypothetical protein
MPEKSKDRVQAKRDILDLRFGVENEANHLIL